MSIAPLGQSKPRTKLWIALAVLTAASVGVSMLLMGPSPPRRIKMATGQEGGAYDAFGKEYQQRLGKRGLTVDLVNSKGSIDNLERLIRGEVDIAFVQGGTYQLVDDPDHKLRGMVALYLEPLWVFYRPQKGDPTTVRVADFEKRKISIGPPGSGTEAVGKLLLNTHGITAENSEILNLPNPEARKRLIDGKLDVAMFVSSYKDPGIQELLARKDIQLMNFQRHDTAHSRQFPYLQPVKVAEGLLNLKDNIPREDVTLLAPAAMLVCREELHPHVVEQVLKTARAIHAPGSLMDAANRFPTLEGVDVAIHESAETYMKSGESALSRLLPYWGVRLILQARILILPLLAVWLPFLKILPMIYNYRVNSLLKKHYTVLRDVESSIAHATNAADLRERIELLDHLRSAMESLSRKVPAHLQRDVYNWRLHVSLVRGEAMDRLHRMEEEEKDRGQDGKVAQPAPQVASDKVTG
jgi:TRAP transporter TAXI family solute receptor